MTKITKTISVYVYLGYRRGNVTTKNYHTLPVPIEYINILFDNFGCFRAFVNK